VPRLYADNLIFIKATYEAGALARSLVCRCCTLCVHRDKATRRALRTQTIKSAPTKGALRRKSIIVCPLSGVLSLFSVCTFPAALLWHFALLHHWQLFRESVQLWDEIYPLGSCSALVPKGCNFIAPRALSLQLIDFSSANI
jgi:hypothetical protein